MRTSLNRLEEESKDFRDEWETLNVEYSQAVTLARVNREHSPATAKRFNVRESPAVFLIINNKVNMREPALAPLPCTHGAAPRHYCWRHPLHPTSR